MKHTIIKLISIKLPIINLTITQITILHLLIKKLQIITTKIILIINIIINIIYITQIITKTKHTIIKIHYITLTIHLIIIKIYIHHNTPLIIIITLLIPPIYLINQIITKQNILYNTIITTNYPPIKQKYTIHQLKNIFLIIKINTITKITIKNILQIIITLLTKKTQTNTLKYIKQPSITFSITNHTINTKL